MVYFLYGAVGTLGVLCLLATGVFIGWNFKKIADRNRKAVETTEEERRKLLAQQQAFESMMSYNTEQAYNMGGDVFGG